jgi:hypothetical protein
MTYTIDIPPEIEDALNADAAAHGMDVSQWAGTLLAERDSGQNAAQHSFLRLLDESAPRIVAGTMRPIACDDITQAIADSRA